MKTKIFKYTLIGLVAFAGLTSCKNTAEENVKDAEENVKDAEDDLSEDKRELEEAQKKLTAEYLIFKSESELAFNENEQKIADLKNAKVRLTKAEREKYDQDIEYINLRNEELKNLLVNYSEWTFDKWELFKKGFNNDMAKLGKKITETANRNNKK
jgi:predicted small secreted protein